MERHYNTSTFHQFTGETFLPSLDSGLWRALFSYCLVFFLNIVLICHFFYLSCIERFFAAGWVLALITMKLSSGKWLDISVLQWNTLYSALSLSVFLTSKGRHTRKEACCGKLRGDKSFMSTHKTHVFRDSKLVHTKPILVKFYVVLGTRARAVRTMRHWKLRSICPCFTTHEFKLVKYHTTMCRGNKFGPKTGPSCLKAG